MNSTKKLLVNNLESLELYLKCKDFTVSGEEFSLVKNNELDLLITHPRPKLENLEAYYESDEYISHTDSKKSVIDKVYQIAKKYAIRKKINLLKKYIDKKKDSKNINILDIGCGTGEFLLAGKKQNWNVVGVEPNTRAIESIKIKIKNLELYNDIKLIKNKNTFDIITMWHVLEHVPNLEEYISHLKKLLKANGTLIIAVPNYKSFDAKYYKENWAAYDVPRHLWHFSKKSISILFKEESLKVIKTLPMKLDSFYVSLLSEKYKNGNSNPLKAFIIGLLSNLKGIRTKEYSSLIYLIKNCKN